MHAPSALLAALTVCGLTLPVGATTHYIVLDSSTYFSGCFPPCECFWNDYGTVRGEFDLTFRINDPVFAYYDVTNVQLTVTSGLGTRIATGSGEYAVGGDPAVMEILQLDLMLDGQLRHFESRHEFSPEFPRIIADVAVNQFTCADTTLGIRSVPVVPGDMNCDGVVNNFDIDPFVLALTNPAAYHEQYPSCPLQNGDANGDGAINNFDIDPFVQILVGH